MSPSLPSQQWRRRVCVRKMGKLLRAFTRAAEEGRGRHRRLTPPQAAAWGAQAAKNFSSFSRGRTDGAATAAASAILLFSGARGRISHPPSLHPSSCAVFRAERSVEKGRTDRGIVGEMGSMREGGRWTEVERGEADDGWAWAKVQSGATVGLT